MNAFDLNPITLSFRSKSLEFQYWEQYQPKMRRKTIVAVGVVMILYSIFGFLDPWIVPEVQETVWLIRAFIFFQCAALILLVSTPLFVHKHQLLIGSLPVIGGMGILIMMAISGETGRRLYYVGLILAMFWTLVFADLRFIYGIPICLALIIGYEGITLYLKPMPLPVLLNNTFFLFSAFVMSGFASYTIERYNRINFYQSLKIEQERQRSEKLLLNVLPKGIVDDLKDRPGTIAQRYPEGSILFADIVGFTSLSVEMEPDDMVNLLNDIFSYFDLLTEKYGVEKIRTIGDSYMVASGVPRPRPDHAQVLARMALDMLRFTTSSSSRPIQFRIGINSGPLVAGVIGRKKFQYDIWGDAVNTASRMESHGIPGKIQVPQDTYELLKDDFIFEKRGQISVKGKGEMETWFLIDQKPSHAAIQPRKVQTGRVLKPRWAVYDPIAEKMGV